MATRCPRCKQHDLTLETFGVFRCQDCGLMTADGEPAASATAEPALVRTEAASFAAPPPARATSPAPPARNTTSRIVLPLVALGVVLTIAKATLPGVSMVRLVVRGSALGAALLGSRPAARYASGALGATLAVDLLNLGAWWPTLSGAGHAVVVALSVLDLVLMGALFAPGERRQSSSD